MQSVVTLHDVSNIDGSRSTQICASGLVPASVEEISPPHAAAAIKTHARMTIASNVNRRSTEVKARLGSPS